MKIAYRSSTVFLLVALALHPFCVAPSARAESAPATIIGGITKVKAHWQDDVGGYNEYLENDFKTTSFTKVEGSIAHRKWGLSAGVNAELDDNAVGGFSRASGYLGIRQLHLRVQSGRLAGTSRYSGPLATGQAAELDFETRFSHVDLLRYMKKSPLYIGLGYTSFQQPTEVATLVTPGGKQNQKNATPVFDPEYKAKIYEFLFGFDTFAGSVIQGEMMIPKSKKGFSMYFASEDRVGFGKGKVSDTAVRAAEELNPGTRVTAQNLTTGWVEFDGNIGISWSMELKSFMLSLGAGWDLLLAQAFSFGGAAENAGELGLDPGTSYLRHGPAFRCYARW